MSELRRLPFVRTLFLGAVSFVLVVASLALDQTAHSRSEAQHLGFGYPVHFASADFTIYYTPPPYAQTYRLNPWEIPVGGNPLAFLVSWLLVYAALLAGWLLVRSTFRRVLRTWRAGGST